MGTRALIIRAEIDDDTISLCDKYKNRTRAAADCADRGWWYPNDREYRLTVQFSILTIIICRIIIRIYCTRDTAGYYY